MQLYLPAVNVHVRITHVYNGQRLGNAVCVEKNTADSGVEKGGDFSGRRRDDMDKERAAG